MWRLHDPDTANNSNNLGRKNAFTYYGDIVIWLFFSPTNTSVFRKREEIHIERTVLVKQTRASGRLGELTISSWSMRDAALDGKQNTCILLVIANGSC